MGVQSPIVYIILYYHRNVKKVERKGFEPSFVRLIGDWEQEPKCKQVRGDNLL
jgi:hypothetical protein